MGRTHDALVRAERERQARARATASASEVLPAVGTERPSLLGRLRRREAAHREEADLAAVLQQVDALGLQLDALEERLAKREPEFEGRLLHLVESRFERLEEGLARSLRAALAEAPRPAPRDPRVTALWGVVLVLFAALLLR